jgi:hypothetical protein
MVEAGVGIQGAEEVEEAVVAGKGAGGTFTAPRFFVP